MRRLFILSLILVAGLPWACGGGGPPGGPVADVGGAPAMIEITFDVDAKRDPISLRHCFKNEDSFLGQNYLIFVQLRKPDNKLRRLPAMAPYSRIVVDDQVKERRGYYVPTGRQEVIVTVKLQKRYSGGVKRGRITFVSCYPVLYKRVISRSFKPAEVFTIKVTNKGPLYRPRRK